MQIRIVAMLQSVVTVLSPRIHQIKRSRFLAVTPPPDVERRVAGRLAPSWGRGP